MELTITLGDMMRKLLFFLSVAIAQTGLASGVFTLVGGVHDDGRYTPRMWAVVGIPHNTKLAKFDVDLRADRQCQPLKAKRVSDYKIEIFTVPSNNRNYPNTHNVTATAQYVCEK